MARHLAAITPLTKDLEARAERVEAHVARALKDHEERLARRLLEQQAIEDLPLADESVLVGADSDYPIHIDPDCEG